MWQRYYTADHITQTGQRECVLCELVNDMFDQMEICFWA